MNKQNKYRSIRVVGFLILTVSGFFLSYKTIQRRTPVVANGMALVPGGELRSIDPETNQNKIVKIKPFLLDKNVVTVADFEAFVKATHYTTEAQKFGNAGVFDKSISGWTLVDGADYLHPFGQDKAAAASNHPVTQVSWNDAIAYAKWKGKRLPTQWEWEFAARNAENNNKPYAWGENLVINGKYKANTWQGSFPYNNTVDDGYEYTAPVGAFGENKLGLTDMGGNVWQWCTDDVKPTPQEAAADPAMRKVLRGGSFLCDPMVCHGFKVTGRSSCTPETALVHIGFRCAKDI